MTRPKPIDLIILHKQPHGTTDKLMICDTTIGYVFERTVHYIGSSTVPEIKYKNCWYNVYELRDRDSLDGYEYARGSNGRQD